MLHLFLIFFLFSSAVADSLISEPHVVPPLDWKTYQFQANCTLFKVDGEKRNFPGSICLFLPDGTFVSIDDNSIKRFSTSREVLWTLKGHFHHQINPVSDNGGILLLTSEIVMRSGKNIRDDVFMKLDLNGNILHQISAMKILKQARISPLNETEAYVLRRLGAYSETSHFNSIYEIPENKYSKKHVWMEKGNIILNSYSLGIFILSPDLQKVLYHKELPFSNDHEFHDVQVTEQGEFLLFNNYRSIPEERDIPHSAIQKFDPVTQKITFEYMAKDKLLFYSPACGGVQEFPEFIFFSHITDGGFFYSKEKKEIILTIPGIAGKSLAKMPVQQIKIVDVRAFLRNSK